jgi:hypothetical protein
MSIGISNGEAFNPDTEALYSTPVNVSVVGQEGVGNGKRDELCVGASN